MVDHSTLEFVGHDSSASAPEYDYGANAPQVDHYRAAPELSYNTGLHEAKEAPIFVGKFDGTEKQTHFGDQPGKAPISGKRKRVCVWILAACSIVIVVAIGVGVGVGLGLRPDRNEVSNDNNSNASTSSMDSTIDGPPNSILNDTSLAAVTTRNGDRRLFFQENSGAIRQAVFDSSSDSWLTDPNQIVVSSSARIKTPISVQALATDPNLNPEIERQEEIRINYITVNNTIGTTVIRDGRVDEVISDSMFDDILNYTSSPTARSFSIAYRAHPAVHRNDNQSDVVVQVGLFEAIVMLELAEDRIAVLLGSGPFDGVAFGQPNNSTLGFPLSHIEGDDSQWGWRDISEEMRAGKYAGWNTSLELEPPFDNKCAFSGTSWYPGASDLLIDMVSFDASNAPDFTSAAVTGYLDDSGILTLPHFFDAGQDPITYTDRESIRRSDFELTWIWGDVPGGNPNHPFFFWVNGTNLSQFGWVVIDEDSVRDQGPFPFPRLASTTATNSTAFYLYNQLNDSSFAQRSWNSRVGTWSTIEYITIET